MNARQKSPGSSEWSTNCYERRNRVKIAERRRRGVARPHGLWNSKFASSPALADNSGQFADVIQDSAEFSGLSPFYSGDFPHR